MHEGSNTHNGEAAAALNYPACCLSLENSVLLACWHIYDTAQEDAQSITNHILSAPVCAMAGGQLLHQTGPLINAGA